MKRTIKLLALAGMFAVFVTPALSQTKECTDEFKSATYQKWYDNRKDKQDVAYQAAKDYLATCTTEDQYSKALKNFVDAYEGLTAKNKINDEFKAAYEGKKYADQIRLGKQIVATDPENSAIYIVMGLAGLGDPSLLNESAEYAKKAYFARLALRSAAARASASICRSITWFRFAKTSLLSGVSV